MKTQNWLEFHPIPFEDEGKMIHYSSAAEEWYVSLYFIIARAKNLIASRSRLQVGDIIRINPAHKKYFEIYWIQGLRNPLEYPYELELVDYLPVGIIQVASTASDHIVNILTHQQQKEHNG